MLWRRWSNRQPVTFNEKVKYKVERDRRPILTTFADKVGVRDYVAAQVGSDVLSTVYDVVDDPVRLDWAKLPEEFACKTAHSSGGVILVWGGADPSNVLPAPGAKVGWEEIQLHPSNLDRRRMGAICTRWLRTPYAWGCGSFEWAYQGVPRRLLIEELHTDVSGQLAPTWLFYVIHGRCQLVRARLSGGRRGFFTPEGVLVNVSYVRQDAADASPRPAIRSAPVPPLPTGRWRRMIEIAERLGAHTDLVRVDLFDVDGRIVFGELTNYPGAGRSRFDPPEFDRELGRLWTVPRTYDSLSRSASAEVASMAPPRQA